MRDPAKFELHRFLRQRDQQKLILYRCGLTVPEDDAGHEYLIELLKTISLAHDPERKMHNAIELLAPWLSETSRGYMIKHVMSMSIRQRWPSAKELGESLLLTNVERDANKLWSIDPYDMTAEALVEHRKKRDRERKRRKRQARQDYLEQFATSAIKTKPWEALGISRATYYRRKEKFKHEGVDNQPQQPCRT